MAAAVLASVGSAQAQTSAASVVVDHQLSTLTHATTRLFAAGPTLSAVTPDGLFRSDDAGGRWRPQPLLPLPPDATLSLVCVDHPGQTVAFAGPDDKPFLRFSAASPVWQAVNLPDHQSHIAALAASPADADVLYALTSGPWPPTGVPVRLYRSHDGGASWDVIDKPCGAIDGLFAAGGLVQPDASDPQRVFTSSNCNGSTGGGAPRSPNIRQSRDQGRTWSDFLKAGVRGVPGIYGDPIGLVGGVAPKPGVYLVSVRADSRLAVQPSFALSTTARRGRSCSPSRAASAAASRTGLISLM